MRQILVRGLDDETVERLKQRARARGRSLQQEIRAILEREARMFTPDEAYEITARWLDELRREYGEVPDTAPLIREDRDTR